jgi:hypothetical protein
MNKFYLNCWVPSLKDYYKVEELKMYQLEILSKYILNDDNESINSFFDEILKENLVNKNIFVKLTRFDKWFLILFLRASSVSSMLHYQVKDAQNNSCVVSFNLFDILTDLSEIYLPEIPTFKFDNTTIDFTVSKKLFTLDFCLDNIFKLIVNGKVFYPQAFSSIKKDKLFSIFSKTIYSEIKEHLDDYKKQFSDIFILKNDKGIKDFYSVRFNLLDNTLYDFLKSTFLPYAQGFYKKKYLLLTKLNISNDSISNLTPFECDIYTNQFNGEKEQLLTE